MNKTIVFPKAEQVIIEDRQRPIPKTGEVLIETEVSLISTGTELTFMKGECPEHSKWSSYIKYPRTTGYSNVGTIVETGEGVSREWIGKRVASFCEHAQYVTAPVEELRVINYDISPEEASFFAIAEIGLNGIRRTGLELGNRVVVYGAGIIGQVLVRFLLAGGCTEIVVVNRSETRLGYLPKTPAVIPVSPRNTPVADVVREATRGDMADVVYETTGNGDIIPEEFQVLHQQGKMCMLSSPKKKTTIDFHDMCNAGSYQIIGAHISSQAPFSWYDNPWTCARNSEVFFRMLHNGQMSVSELISHRISFEEAPDMYRSLLEDRSQTMGIILRWK